jgi:large subunit ribosomal protein L3
VVTQVKSNEKDGYAAVQIGFGTIATKHVTKPLKGHLKLESAAVTAPRYSREIKTTTDDALELGSTVKASDIIKVGDKVNVTGTTKGRGFAGAMKRWGFKGGPKTHGQSDRARAVGSIGQGTDPGRVHKGKKMPGHYGNVRFTVKNLQVIHIDEAENLLWIAGAIPGANGNLVEVHYLREGKFAGLHTLVETVAEEVKTDVSAEEVEEVKTEEVIAAESIVEQSPELAEGETPNEE